MWRRVLGCCGGAGANPNPAGGAGGAGGTEGAEGSNGAGGAEGGEQPSTSSGNPIADGLRDIYEQEKNKEPIDMQKQRFRGCMLAGAAGDALGGVVEFWTKQKIERHYGERGIRDLDEAYNRVGAITDDTQMTLFTAEALLRSRQPQGPDTPYSFGQSYQRWLKTQSATSPVMQRHPEAMQGGLLMGRGELYDRRAPGVTCLNALKAMENFTDKAKNDSKGCGGVMRVAPIGLYYASNHPEASLDAVFTQGAEAATVTHGHVTSTLSSGVFACLVFLVAQGRTLTSALADVKELLKTKRDHGETLRAIELAEQLVLERVPPRQAIPRLGEGWIAEEALAIGIYSVLATPTLEEAVVVAVNHEGDSDSTGSIAGQLAGAIYGYDAIPHRWLAQLELRDTLEDVTKDLLESGSWVFDPTSPDDVTEKMAKRYPK